MPSRKRTDSKRTGGEKKKSNDRALSIALIAVLVVLIALIVLFSYTAYARYALFKSHRDYLRQPDAQVQPWMTVRGVERRFNISESDILQELGTNQSQSVQRLTIAGICAKNRLNCTDAIDRINALRNG